MDRLDRVWALELTNALPWHNTSVHSTRKPVSKGVGFKDFSTYPYFPFKNFLQFETGGLPLPLL